MLQTHKPLIISNTFLTPLPAIKTPLTPNMISRKTHRPPLIINPQSIDL